MALFLTGCRQVPRLRVARLMFVLARGGADAMVGWNAKAMTASLVILGTLSVPAIGSAQSYRYRGEGRQSVVVKCAPGQRAVMAQRRGYGESRTIARCVGSRRTFNDGYGRRIHARGGGYDRDYRPSRSRYYERRPRRSTAKTALMIAGGAATGAGVGGAVRGKKGALIGAAVGGGAASIYEAAKRR
jgi:hypothetical protein